MFNGLNPMKSFNIPLNHSILSRLTLDLSTMVHGQPMIFLPGTPIVVSSVNEYHAQTNVEIGRYLEHHKKYQSFMLTMRKSHAPDDMMILDT